MEFKLEVLTCPFALMAEPSVLDPSGMSMTGS